MIKAYEYYDPVDSFDQDFHKFGVTLEVSNRSEG